MKVHQNASNQSVERQTLSQPVERKTKDAGLTESEPESRLAQLKTLADTSEKSERLTQLASAMNASQQLKPKMFMAGPCPVQRKTTIKNEGQECTYISVKDQKEKHVTVGDKMEAWLDPESPIQGQSACINTSQDELMDRIKTNFPEAAGVLSVKGHLLNDNLGGTALGNNLFPISKGANGKHLSTAENFVKNKVWKEKKGVKYTIDVKGYDQEYTVKGKAQFVANVFDWDVKTDVTGDKIYSTTIESDFGKPKLRKAYQSDNADTKTGNICGWSLRPPIGFEPFKTVGELTSVEKEHRSNQPTNLIIESNGRKKEYKTNIDSKTQGKETPTDQPPQIMTIEEIILHYMSDKQTSDITDIAETLEHHLRTKLETNDPTQFAFKKLVELSMEDFFCQIESQCYTDANDSLQHNQTIDKKSSTNGTELSVAISKFYANEICEILKENGHKDADISQIYHHISALSAHPRSLWG